MYVVHDVVDDYPDLTTIAVGDLEERHVIVHRVGFHPEGGLGGSWTIDYNFFIFNNFFLFMFFVSCVRYRVFIIFDYVFRLYFMIKAF